MRRLALIPVLAALVLAGCGSSAPAHKASLTFCSGLTDTCRTAPLKYGQTFGSAQGRIPDVSSYQGHPNWSAAKAAGIAGGIFKGGEYGVDPTAAYNNAQLRTLHLWRAMYWFVRNTGCSHEAAQIIAEARQLGVPVVVNDLETREAAGYGACLVPAERKAGLTAVDYTAPGSWPGGSGYGGAPLWQAEYGPTLHPFWRPVVSWQCTDGVYGCVTYVPGIGADDVSLNLGITKLGVPPTPPKPKPARVVCFPTSSSSACKPVLALYRKRIGAAAASNASLQANACVVPYRRGVCVHLGQRARWFAVNAAALRKAYS